MIRYACIVLLTVLPLLSRAEENTSALKALKVLPQEEAKNLARIEAHDGTPAPERWHFLVHDPKAESGLKEYVVAKGEVVASRDVSQFAESLTAADVIEAKALQTDSDKLAQLAKDYAAANKAEVAKLSYQLLKEGEEAEPVWRVNCLDEGGQPLGTLVVTAAKGDVVSHEGFPVKPKSKPREQKADKKKKKQAKLEFETEAEPLIAVNAESNDEESEAVDTDEERGSEAALDEDASEAAGQVIAGSSSRKRSSASVSKGGSSYKKKRTASVSRSSSYRRHHHVRRRAARVPNPVTVVRRVTSPVRYVVRRILPF